MGSLLCRTELTLRFYHWVVGLEWFLLFSLYFCLSFEFSMSLYVIFAKRKQPVNLFLILETDIECPKQKLLTAQNCVPLEEVWEKAMAPHSSTLAWKIPWTELQSMGSLRVRHDWATSLSHFTCMHWRRKWQPTVVFLPGESQGRGSLVGFCLWGHTESDTTEAT